MCTLCILNLDPSKLSQKIIYFLLLALRLYVCILSVHISLHAQLSIVEHHRWEPDGIAVNLIADEQELWWYFETLNSMSTQTFIVKSINIKYQTMKCMNDVEPFHFGLVHGCKNYLVSLSESKKCILHKAVKVTFWIMSTQSSIICHSVARRSLFVLFTATKMRRHHNNIFKQVRNKQWGFWQTRISSCHTNASIFRI